jgi:HD-GYP domain-containing protein (c-di-GMP phosphodiesterase class II)
MIKKIKVALLRPGMFIHDLNCGWMRHPFMSNSIKIKDEKTIDKIIRYGIHEVYIDSNRGLDVTDAPTEEEVKKEIQTELKKVAEIKSKTDIRVPLKKELVKAREIKREVKQTVQNIMEEIRFGKPIRTEKVENVVKKMIDSIFRNQDALVSLGRIKQTDEYTYMHSMSVCVLMISFGKHLGFDIQKLNEVGIGSMLHDIGKMKVPQEILNSNRQLSDKEFNLVKEHVKYSRDLLKETQGIRETSILLAAQHHERIDGRGYPEGLKGDEISLYGQTAAIADVYDAMTSKRCYQRKFEPADVLKKLFEWRELYNPDLVQQFIRCVGIYPVSSLVRLESGLLGVVLNHSEKGLLYPVVRVVYDTKKERQVMPYDIDLSQISEDRVESSESTEKWNINTEIYL